MAATYAKYCPNVFVAKCSEEHAKGDIITVTTKYGKENECEVWNLVAQKDGFFYYSITRTDGYNSQERARRIAERLETSAGNASAQSEAYAQKSHDYVAGIVPGQPILVGHHSERHHRKAIENSNRAMGKAVELDKKADDYERRAEYWRERAEVINLSMPESIDFYAFKVEQLTKAHQYLKDHPEARSHGYALTYAKKDLKRGAKELSNRPQIVGKIKRTGERSKGVRLPLS